MELLPIGGYFGFENNHFNSHVTERSHVESHRKLDLLNQPSSSNRRRYLFNSLGNALLIYLLNHSTYYRIHIPAYCCSSISKKLERYHIRFKFYNNEAGLALSHSFINNLDGGDLLVVANIFGVMDENLNQIIELSKNRGVHLVIDSAHSIAFEAQAQATLYSPRKFIGIPDGGILDTCQSLEIAVSNDKVHQVDLGHLSLRKAGRISEGYIRFLENEKKIEDAAPCAMSFLSRDIVTSFPIEQSIVQRLNNFSMLHTALYSYNDIFSNYHIPRLASPLYYPFLHREGKRIRDSLITMGVFCPVFWRGIETLPLSMYEKRLLNDCVLLPIDHRYGQNHMDLVIDYLRVLI